MFSLLNMELKQRIAAAVVHSGKKKSHIAAEIGVSPSAITQWISGQTTAIDGINLLKFSRATGARYEWIALEEGGISELLNAPNQVGEHRAIYNINDKIDPLQLDLGILDKYDAEAYIARIKGLKSEIKALEDKIEIIEADIRAAADRARKQQEKSDLKPEPAAQDSPLSDRRTA